MIIHQWIWDFLSESFTHVKSQYSLASCQSPFFQNLCFLNEKVIIDKEHVSAINFSTDIEQSLLSHLQMYFYRHSPRKTFPNPSAKWHDDSFFLHLRNYVNPPEIKIYISKYAIYKKMKKLTTRKINKNLIYRSWVVLFPISI